MTQTNSQIIEEFNKRFPPARNGDYTEHPRQEILSFFFSKIDELLKSQREEMVNKIEKHQNFITMSDYDVGYNDCKENIINLIKNN